VAGELLIDVDEAAHRLAVCRRVVCQLISDGVLPSVKIHRSRRVAVADLEHYVDELRADFTSAVDERGTNYRRVMASGTSPSRLSPMA
jgi:excisionase family DNA binding protein